MPNTKIFKTLTEKNNLIIECPEELLGGKEGTEFSQILRDNNGSQRVVVDLSQVKVINSTGVGMLVGGFTTCKKNGSELVLAGAGESIGSILKMTHLDKVFTVYSNVEEAIA
jgi:anti-sigma B factor antagonist